MKQIRSFLKKWGGRVLLVLAAVLLITTVAGAIKRARLRAAYPPPGQLVDVGGFYMHIHCMGEGGPTVLLEAGQGNIGLIWSTIQAEVARTTRVCAYDRAGLGWSEAGPAPRTAGEVVDELHLLLTNGGIEGPYVLVGHSLGGLFTRLYTHRYPTEVAGLVLIDAVHEDRFVRGPAEETTMLRNIIAVMPYFYRAQRLWAVTGIPALLPPAAADTLELPAETALAYQNVLKGRPATIGAIAAELAALEAYYEEVRAADIDSLGQLPLVVLRHGRPLAYEGIAPETNQLMEAAWQQFQAELAAQSTRGELLVAVDSGHNIMLDQPELVVETIVRVVTAAQEDAAIAGR